MNMNVRELIAKAVKREMTGDMADEIARQLVDAAKGGDLEAVKMVLGFAAFAEQIPSDDPAECTHPPNSRTTFPQTMGGGPKRESCSCGALLLDGKSQE